MHDYVQKKHIVDIAYNAQTYGTRSYNAHAYIGRFLPSPTGALHLGSLVAAVACQDAARAAGGQWLLRIDDTDLSRIMLGADKIIIAQLAHYGLHHDGEITYASQNRAAHALALAKLTAAGRTYGCVCSRKDVQMRLVALGLPPDSPYPKTCLGKNLPSNPLDAGIKHIRLKNKEDDDFVLHTYDPKHLDAHGSLFNYQLTVVVDDATAGVTHVVRGSDLADNTPRQNALQQLLGLATPLYTHVPVVLGADGAKLSKHNHAAAIPLDSTAAEKAALLAWVSDFLKNGG